MSIPLVALTFPLTGTRLIEASAGTGKTYTIAALYIRLILGHGMNDGTGFSRSLLPCEILVMTFTKAATKELSERIRARLVESARCFRGLEVPNDSDHFLIGLLASYHGDAASLEAAAYRLTMAADAMDECAVLTIDAWCQRMLREHAFDSSCPFEEELISDEKEIREDALRDYWREQVYALDVAGIRVLRCVFKDHEHFVAEMDELVKRAYLIAPTKDCSLTQVINDYIAVRDSQLPAMKAQWMDYVNDFKAWFHTMQTTHKGALSGIKIKADAPGKWFSALSSWAKDPELVWPDQGVLTEKVWEKLTPAGISSCFNAAHANKHPITPVFERTAELLDVLRGIPDIEVPLREHAAVHVAKRLAYLKERKHQAGFFDMLVRLRDVLASEQGEVLRERIRTEFPVALVDEFQDTSPEQYCIFNSLYGEATATSDCALFMIGDPKQAIYSFRGADIHSYLAARRATVGRHYRLDRNFRSTQQLVDAVNHVFNYAENLANDCGHGRGAFLYREKDANEVPFEPVQARGRSEVLHATADGGTFPIRPMTIWAREDKITVDDSRRFFSELCAERIALLLNDVACGFYESDRYIKRLAPADIAILVRDKNEAAAVRKALQRRKIQSVYLSDSESVFRGQPAKDLVLWLKAVASPLDGALARAAYATSTACRPLADLAALVEGDAALERHVEMLSKMKDVWQRQGILPMVRRLVLRLNLPALLLNTAGGERVLTDLLHLAELLQQASFKVDGEQALIRWLCQQIEKSGNDGDDVIQRLESDADLVRIVTIYKAKGLQYPLVFLPFAATAKVVDSDRNFCEFADASGMRRLDLTISPDAVAAMERARLEEDMRLLYVALTRAEHAVWLGVTTLAKTNVGASAFGHILTGTDKDNANDIPPADLVAAIQMMTRGCAHIDVQAVAEDPQTTPFIGDGGRAACVEPAQYDGTFERNWSVASYSSLTRTLTPGKATDRAPETPLQDKLQQEADDAGEEVEVTQKAPWHTFPRGPLPGQFMHDQLEWLAHEGFKTALTESFSARLLERCQTAGWDNRHEQACAWIKEIVSVRLPGIDCSLSDLSRVVPEMEFWLPAEGAMAADIDAICRMHLLEGAERSDIADRKLLGMLRGFKDLVFERNGKYWILDYKASLLASDDVGYTHEALRDSMAKMRYDIQGAIYMLALHRLLKSRLADGYDPSMQLGGVVFYFLRGVANSATRGCYQIAGDPIMLDQLDRLIATKDAHDQKEYA